MTEVEIRPATIEDARGVAIVHVDTWRAAYEGLIPRDVLDGLDVDARTDGWTRWLRASLAGEPTEVGSPVTQRLLVAEAAGRIIGWAGFGLGRDEGMGDLGELGGLYVHPEHWSTGVGHTLIERVADELRADGLDVAYLWVLDGNARAISFYERHGWIADGTHKTVDLGPARQLHELRHVRRLG